MKILLVQDRNNNHHLVDYCSIYGHKYTICGLMYIKKDILNTINLDAPISIVCKKCYCIYEKILQEMKVDNLRNSNGSLLPKLKNQYNLIQLNVLNTHHKYGYLICRNSRKIVKLKAQYGKR